MSQPIAVGPFSKGLRNDIIPVYIDNDSFPVLINAYQWRGRVKRKRGTSLLGRLSRFLGTTDGSGNLTVTIAPAPIPSGISSFTIGTDVFTDPGGVSPVTLITNSSGSATLNRTTGVLTITGSQTATAVIFYPSLPVMGLEDLILTSTQFPGNLFFDTNYVYNVLTSTPFSIYDVGFYKNPPTGTVNYPGYVQKTTVTPISWNGQNYQQFWSTNYQGAFWVTNGINVPFSPTNIGMQFKPIVTTTVTSGGPPAIVTLQITAHGLIKGDFVFVNEVATTTGINFQTGYVVTVVDANNVSVEFPNATIATNGTGGIAQYLTNRSDPTKDCIRWYDGDPTNANPTNPSYVPGNGWVNYMPPLSQGIFSIADLPALQYYLVGARIIFPSKDRLIFIGPVVQASGGNSIYLQDTIIYTQNGTPYYTASYTNVPTATIDTPVSAGNVFTPILVPTNQTATSPALFTDQTGFGGFLTAGVAQPALTLGQNEDNLIIGFSTFQTRFVYTGNDILPFNLFITNSELGSSSTFSVITMDKAVMTRGNRGIIVANQTGAQRIDLPIPDQVYQMSLTNNGAERITAQRDFINEWIYLSYPEDMNTNVFNTQTLLYNYRDDSWAIFNESYTTYGQFRISSGLIWATVGNTYPTWSEWNTPWNAGDSNTLQPQVIGGNQQGFVLFREQGNTGEANSLTIQNISGNTVTSPNHCLNEGDYFIINNCLGTVGSQVNGKIFSVLTSTTNTFTLNPPIVAGTYLGSGTIQRMYVPFIQTKQFPTAWQMARKTRIAAQKYLFTTTPLGQIELDIYLSQDSANPYSRSPIVPDPTSINNSLIYSTTIYTCPESTNLGLTPANINLQTPTAAQQEQLWHRMNTSLIGDSVQIGFTLSDAQMRSLVPTGPTFTITGATAANPCVLTAVNDLSANQLVTISGVVGMTQLNGNTYIISSANSTSITLNLDSSAFTAYSSGGTVTPVYPNNQFEEIELHGFILDTSPSQLLV